MTEQTTFSFDFENRATDATDDEYYSSFPVPAVAQQIDLLSDLKKKAITLADIPVEQFSIAQSSFLENN